MRKLSKREHRLVTVGVIAAAVIILTVWVILPFLDRRATASDKLEEEARFLERSILEAEREDLYRDQLEQLNRSLTGYRQGLLDAQDSKIAYIRLEELVRDLAAEHDVTITRSNPLREGKFGDRYSKITLQINLQTDMSQLTDFLYALSSHRKFLVVEEFFLQGMRRRKQIQIRPRLNVSAFIRLS